MAEAINLKGKYLQAFLEGSNYLGRRGVLLDEYDEPTYFGFWIEFPDLFIQNSGLFNDYDSLPNGLLFNKESDYSAERYLRAIGEVGRADTIAAFRQILGDMSRNTPYYIKEIGGLDSIYEVDPEKNNRDEAKITLSFEEAIDNRMTALFDTYRKAAYDEKYRRWILPDIMRMFSMNIYITEFRRFHVPRKNERGTDNPARSQVDVKSRNVDDRVYGGGGFFDQLGQKAGKARESLDKALEGIGDLSAGITNLTNGDPFFVANEPEYFLKALDRNFSILKFELKNCEFDIKSFKPSWAETINNGTGTERVTGTVEIKVGKVNESNQYSALGVSISQLLKRIDSNHLSGTRENSLSPYTQDTYQQIIGEDSYSNADGVYNTGVFKDGHLQNAVKKTLGERLVDNARDRAEEGFDNLVGSLEDILQEAFTPPLGNVFDDLPAASSELSRKPLTNSGLTGPDVSAEGRPQNAGLDGPNPKGPDGGNIGLTGPPSSDSKLTNAGLGGPNTSIEGNPGNSGLSGGDSNIDGNPGNSGLSGPNTSIEGNPGNSGLSGRDSNIEGNPGNSGLSGPNVNSNGNPGNVGLSGGDSSISGNPGDVGLDGGDSDIAGNPGNVGLSGGDSNISGNPGNSGLSGGDSSIDDNVGNVGLDGGDSDIDGNPGNSGLSGVNTSIDGDVSNIGLSGGDSNINGKTSNIGLDGGDSNINANLENIGFEGNESTSSKLGNIGLSGEDSKDSEVGNIGLTGDEPKKSQKGNIGLSGIETEPDVLGNIGLPKESNKVIKQENIGLEGRDTETSQLGNIGLQGTIKESDKLGNIGIPIKNTSDKGIAKGLGNSYSDDSETREVKINKRSPGIPSERLNNIRTENVYGEKPDDSNPTNENIGLDGHEPTEHKGKIQSSSGDQSRENPNE